MNRKARSILAELLNVHKFNVAVWPASRVHSAISEALDGALPNTHPDDDAVDEWAALMKAKLAEKRREGRGGWHDESACSIKRLVDEMHYNARMIQSDTDVRVTPSLPINVANLAMMIALRIRREPVKKVEYRFNLKGR